MKLLRLLIIVSIVAAVLVFCPSAEAQSTSFSISCNGSADTSKFTNAVTIIGANKAKLTVNYRTTPCVTNSVTIPANITLDLTNSPGITVNTGQTLTVLSSARLWPTKKIFFNATAGLGTVSFAGNTSMEGIYPQWWGALTTGDDSPSILAAITAANSAGGGKVKFTKGTFTPGSIMSLSGMSNITIEGDGPQSVLVNLTADRTFNLANSSHVTIRNLTSKGDFDQSLPSHAGQGLMVSNNASSSEFSQYITLENIFCDHLAGDCIRFGPNTRYVNASNIFMDGGLGFVEFSGVVSGGDIRPVSWVDLSKFHAKGTVSGGISGGSVSGSDDLIDVFGGTDHVRIHHGSLDLGATSSTTTTNSSGIILIPVNAQGPITDVTIDHVQLYRFNSTAVAVPDQSAIWLSSTQYTGDSGLRNIVIDTVDIDDCHYGILFADGNAGSTADGISINNATVSNCLRGIDIRNSSYVTVDHPVIRYPKEIGIALNGTEVSLISPQVYLNGALVSGLKAGIFSTSGNNKTIDSAYVTGGPSGSKSVYIAAGTGTRLFQPRILANAGTGLTIDGAAVSTYVSEPVISGNGTNLTDGGTTTQWVGFLRKNVVLDFAQLPAPGTTPCEVLTTTVTGAVVGDMVTIGMGNTLPAVNATSTFFAWVSAADTVAVRRCVILADGSDPGAAVIFVTVNKNSLP